MMFGKLGLVMIVVRDMERSVAFYRDVLGLKLLIHQDNWSQLDAGNIIIGLHPEGDEVKVSPTTGMSIGIYVDDMDQGRRRNPPPLRQNRHWPAPDPFGRWALVFDPDGYSIQIIEMARSLRAQHKLAAGSRKRTEFDAQTQKSLRRGGGIFAVRKLTCGLCDDVAVMMMVVSVVRSGKRRHRCAEQQKHRPIRRSSISSTLFLQRTPLGASTLFLAL